MKKILRYALTAFLTSLPIYTLAQQQCGPLFAENSEERQLQILQELASFKVDAELATDPMSAKVLLGMYKRKYAALQKAGKDLSRLPELVEIARGKKNVIVEKEGQRKQEALRAEKKMLLSLQPEKVPGLGHIARFSDDGSMYLRTDRSRLDVFDSQTGAVLQTFNSKNEFLGAKFSHDGRFIISAKLVDAFEKHAPVFIWDIVLGKKVKTLIGHSSGNTKDFVRQRSVNNAEMTPDGKRLLTWSDFGHTAVLWDLDAFPGATAEIVSWKAFTKDLFKKSKVQKFDSHGVAQLSPDGKTVQTIDNFGAVVLWTESPSGEWNKLVLEKNHPEDKFGKVIFNRDGSKVAARGYLCTAVWEVKTGHHTPLVMEEGADFNAAEFSFSPDGNKIVATGHPSDIYGGNRQIEHSDAILWDANTGAIEVIFTDKARGNYNAVAFTPDGRYIFFGVGSGADSIWTTSGVKLRNISDSVMSDWLVASPTENKFLTSNIKAHPIEMILWKEEP